MIQGVSKQQSVCHLPELSISQNELDNFKTLAERAAEAVAQYDGSEEAYRQIWIPLIEVDRWFKNKGFESSDELESQVAKMAGISKFTIGSMLTVCIEKWTDSLMKSAIDLSLSQTLVHLNNQGICVVASERTYLPADSQPFLSGFSSGNFELRYKNKLLEFVCEMQLNGLVFKEDIIIREGRISKNMFRSEPYIIIEIPRLDCQVLICNLIGETTFVAKGIYSDQYFANATKSELKDNPDIHQVTYDKNWFSRIKDIIWKDKDHIRKVDIKDFLELTNAVKSTYCAESWLNMSFKEKLSFRVPGSTVSMNSLCTRLGIKGTPADSRLVYLELGEKIFGKGSVISVALQAEKRKRELQIEVRNMTESEIISRIKSKYTDQSWAAMTYSDRESFTIPGTDIGIYLLFMKLGIKGDPLSYKLLHLRMGRKIFAESTYISALIEKEEAKKADKDLPIDQIISRVKSQTTPQSWVEMSVIDKRNFRVKDTSLSLYKLASSFGIRGDPVGCHVVHLEVGNIIFDSDRVVSSALENERKKQTSKSLSAQDITDKIKSELTAEVWCNMSYAARRSFVLAETTLNLYAISQIFGIKGNPARNRLTHLELGSIIFPENSAILKEIKKEEVKKFENLLSNDKIVSLIKEAYTAECWFNLSKTERNSFRVPGTSLTLYVLSSKFGLRGDPRLKRSLYLQLGEKIFGPGTVISAELEKIQATE